MDSAVTFWHRHRAKSEAKIAPLDRPGHAVSPLRGCAGPGVCCNLRKHWAGNHGFQRTEAGPKTLLVRNGFRRDVLTSEPGEKWGENSFPGPAWPCGFTVATRFFVSRWNVTFWHRHRAKSEAKIAPLDRPGHAVSPLRGCAGPGVCCNLRKHWARNHGFQRSEAGPKTSLVRNGFRRDVLTSEPGLAWPSDVTFWHRNHAKSEAKIAFLDRPGHAGSLLRRVFLSVAGTAKIR